MLHTHHDTLNRVGGVVGATPTSWENVLKLAERWTFTDLRSIAITHIERHEDCVLRLHMARRYGVHRLLPDALGDLAERDEPLTQLDHERLGSKLGVDVMRYREARWRSDVDPEYVLILLWLSMKYSTLLKHRRVEEEPHCVDIRCGLRSRLGGGHGQFDSMNRNAVVCRRM